MVCHDIPGILCRSAQTLVTVILLAWSRQIYERHRLSLYLLSLFVFLSVSRCYFAFFMICVFVMYPFVKLGLLESLLYICSFVNFYLELFVMLLLFHKHRVYVPTCKLCFAHSMPNRTPMGMRGATGPPRYGSLPPSICIRPCKLPATSGDRGFSPGP
jgi:hypothetical protein